MADFEDEFTDTDTTELDNHTPSVGTAWTGPSTSNAEISSNQLATVDNTSLQIITCDDLGDADHQIWFKVGSVAPEDGNNSRICCRLVDTTKYALGFSFGAGSALLVTSRDGSTNSLFTEAAVAADEWLRMKVEGDSVSWYRGGTGAEPTDPHLDTNWTESTNSPITSHTVANTETSAGFILWGTSAGSTLADPWIDSYRHHTLAVAGVPPSGLNVRGALGGIQINGGQIA